MGGVDFVVPVGADHNQMLHIRLGQQILEQMERCCVKPLQVVEEESKRMIRPCEDADEPPEDQLEPALRVLWWKKRHRWLFSEDVLQLRDEVYNQQPVRTQRLTKGVAPDAQVCIGFTQQ